jgi:hypothetical protein
VGTLSVDTCLRPDQAGLGTSSGGETYTINGSLTTSISSNEAVVTGSSGFTSALLGAQTTADIDITVRVEQINNNFDGVGPTWRSDATGANCYFIALYAGTILFAKLVGGGFSSIASTNISEMSGTYYQMHVKMIGNHLQARAWQDGTSEPGTWNIDTTDSTYAAAGRYGMSFNAFSGAGIHFDHITVTNGTSSTQDTKTAGLRAVVKTKRTLSTGLRARIKTNTTRTSGVRVRVKTAHTLSTGIRFVTPTPVQTTLSTGLRALIGTLHSHSTGIRYRVRSEMARLAGLRFRIPAGKSAQTAGMRFVVQSAGNVLAQDTFERANQSGWGTSSDGQEWTPFGSITANIVGNEGVLTNSTGFPGMLIGSKTTDTISIQVRLSQDDINHGCGVCFRYQDPDNYYFVSLYQSQIYFSAIISGSYHNFVLGGYAASTGSYSQLLVEMSGDHLQAVAWPDHTNQPTDAILDTTDSTFSSGQFGVSVNAFTGSGGPSFDSLFVTNTVAGMSSPGSGGGSGSSISIPWNGVGKSTHVPIPLSLISRGCPAYTNDDYQGAYPASRAVDGDYQTLWRSQNTPTALAPIYLALDLSGVAESKRQQVLVQWINDPSTGAWDSSLITVNYYNVPKAYTIDVNATAGGSYPTTGWITIATETDNPYHSRMYSFDMTGYNWVRINVTDVNGSDLNMSVQLNMDVYNAASGLSDCWAFGGDSITQQGALHNDQAGGTFAQLIQGYNAHFYPAFDSWGIGGYTSNDAYNHWAEWMATFPGQFITLNYGTNDANESGVYMSTYQMHMTSMIEAVIAAGKIPIVPLIPWGATDNLLANVPTLNAIIQQLYVAYPQIIPGPDMYTYYAQNQDLIGSDGIHPTLTSGYDAWRQLWVNAMMTNIYTPPPTILTSIAPFTLSPSFYGGATVPVVQPPVLPYAVNGMALDVQPVIMTAPCPTSSVIPAGASFTLGFHDPSTMVTSLFTTGATFSLQFGLHDGSSRTADVVVESSLIGSYLSVICTLTTPAPNNVWVISTQSS